MSEFVALLAGGPEVFPRFSPRDISGLRVWLEANNITGIVDGGLITTWSDQSGNGFNGTQSTEGLRAVYKTGIINGRPIVRFDGDDDYYDIDTLTGLNQPLTIIVAAKIRSGADTDRTYVSSQSSAGGVDFSMYAESTDSKKPYLYAGSGPASGDNPDMSTAWTIYTAVCNNGSSTIFVDNASRSTEDIGANDPSALRIGDNSGLTKPADADMYAVLVYDTALGTADRGAAEEYLATKLAITLA